MKGESQHATCVLHLYFRSSTRIVSCFASSAAAEVLPPPIERKDEERGETTSTTTRKERTCSFYNLLLFGKNAIIMYC